MTTKKPYKKHIYKGRTTPTPKQQKIIELVCSGLRNKEVAQILKREEKTIKFHLTRIFSDFGVKTRTQLALKLMKVKE